MRENPYEIGTEWRLRRRIRLKELGAMREFPRRAIIGGVLWVKNASC